MRWATRKLRRLNSKIWTYVLSRASFITSSFHNSYSSTPSYWSIAIWIALCPKAWVSSGIYHSWATRSPTWTWFVWTTTRRGSQWRRMWRAIVPWFQTCHWWRWTSPIITSSASHGSPSTIWRSWGRSTSAATGWRRSSTCKRKKKCRRSSTRKAKAAAQFASSHSSAFRSSSCSTSPQIC